MKNLSFAPFILFLFIFLVSVPVTAQNIVGRPVELILSDSISITYDTSDLSIYRGDGILSIDLTLVDKHLSTNIYYASIPGIIVYVDTTTLSLNVSKGYREITYYGDTEFVLTERYFLKTASYSTYTLETHEEEVTDLLIKFIPTPKD